MTYGFNDVWLIMYKLIEQKPLWLNQTRNIAVSGRKNKHSGEFKPVAERMYWNTSTR